VWQLYAATGRSSRPSLHRPQEPTHVVAGGDDASVPIRNCDRSPGVYRTRVSTCWKGGGQMFLLDEPEKAAGEITQFRDEGE
jgi:hypothetical protein